MSQPEIRDGWIVAATIQQRTELLAAFAPVQMKKTTKQQPSANPTPFNTQEQPVSESNTQQPPFPPKAQTPSS
jgi:hypothetical protein